MLFVTSCVVLKNNCSFVLTFDGLRYATPVVLWDTLDVQNNFTGSGVLKKTEISGFTGGKDIAFGTCR